jgi:type I restriction enzyme S subunit
MSVPAGYKATEVGVIPEDWNLEPLGTLIGPLDAGVSVRSVVDNVATSSDGQMVLKTSCISSGRFIPTEAKPILLADLARAKTSVKGGSILISRMNTPDLVGEVGYVPQDRPNLYLPDRLWMASSATGRRSDMRWLAAHLSHGKAGQALRDTATGTSGSMKNISKTALRRVLIPTPQPQEQSAIAEALSDVDEAIAAQEAVIAKKRALKTATMQALLSGTRRLPGFRGEWGSVTLDELGHFSKGKGLPKNELFSMGSLPAIPYTAIYTDFEGIIEKDQIKNFVSRKMGLAIIGSPHLLFAGSSNMLENVGKAVAYIGQDEVAIGGDILIYRTGQNVGFLAYLLSAAQHRDRIVALSQGSTIRHVYPSTFEDYKLSIPELCEQNAIVSIIGDQVAEIRAEHSKLAKLRYFKMGMMQQLLTGKIRLV